MAALQVLSDVSFGGAGGTEINEFGGECLSSVIRVLMRDARWRNGFKLGGREAEGIEDFVERDEWRAEETGVAMVDNGGGKKGSAGAGRWEERGGEGGDEGEREFKETGKHGGKRERG